MASFLIDKPTRLRLPPELDQRLLKSHLAYKDRRAEFDLRRLKDHASWHIRQMGEAEYQDKVEELLARIKGTLVFEDELLGQWTYSGMAAYLLDKFTGHDLQVNVSYPSVKTIPWQKPPPPLRGYQEEACALLLHEDTARYPFPRSVEMGTGLGKSRIIMELLRNLGRRSVVMAPSTSIAGQLLKQATAAFGAKNVGAFFDGKKQFNKLITVGTHQSLGKIEPDSPIWTCLSGAEVFIADESHMCPADTLASVCLGSYQGRTWQDGLCAGAPYRFFFSGTQIRGDGLELVLKGIIGEPLYTMSVRDGVAGGWLAKPNFCMVNVESQSDFYSKDANKLTREHLFKNPDVNRIAGLLTNRFADSGKYVLVLVDELTQVPNLLPHLRVPFGLAHGGVTKDNRDALPAELHKSDPDDLVEKFNAGQLPCLIGTSCIGTGTDIKPPGQMVILYMVGGRSETQLRQYIGRGTRREGKDSFLFFDFDVGNIDVLHRHANDRRAIYAQVYGAAREMRIE